MKLDNATRVLLLQYCRKYELYKADIKRRRDEIMSLSVQQYDDMDMPRGTDMHNGVEARAEALEKLENSHKAKIVAAVDYAKETALPDDLRNEIWLSCMNGRKYRYEAFQNLWYSRSSFYSYKKMFLWAIKTKLQL